MPQRKKLSTGDLQGLGLEVQGTSGDEACCDCPFCGKEGHFHYNEAKQVGHCKVCEASPTAIGIAGHLVEKEWDIPSGKSLSDLAKWRGLPQEAFTSSTLRVQAGTYALVCKDRFGKVYDVRRCSLRGKWFSLPGARVTLFGAEQLAEDDRRDQVHYLCEGEWDAIAMGYALRAASKSGVVLGVPGASIFKEPWGDWLAGRRVVVLYDNDASGAAGEQRVAKVLRHRASSVRFHRWPAEAPDGFDISDLIGGA